ncbi:MAG: metallophosphoesterase [Burkholderiales bacterium]
MRFLILSDLHLEWAKFRPPGPDRFDAVILAGDISQGPKAVAWAQRQPEFAGKPVVLVPGNHEFYGLERERTLERMREGAANSHVHVLDRDELVLPGDGRASGSVRVLGTTLWTDFKLSGPDVDAAMAYACRGMNDFSGSILQRELLGRGRRRFTPGDSLVEHQRSRAWLRDRLEEPGPAGTATIVVTHHGPSVHSIAPQYEGNDLNSCFCSELPAPFFERPALWVHGHVHNSFDYRIGRTRVVANPRGYFFRPAGSSRTTRSRPTW